MPPFGMPSSFVDRMHVDSPSSYVMQSALHHHHRLRPNHWRCPIAMTMKQWHVPLYLELHCLVDVLKQQGSEPLELPLDVQEVFGPPMLLHYLLQQMMNPCRLHDTQAAPRVVVRDNVDKTNDGWRRREIQPG